MKFDALVLGLKQDGFFIIDHALSKESFCILQAEIKKDEEKFKDARVGKFSGVTQKSEVGIRLSQDMVDLNKISLRGKDEDVSSSSAMRMIQGSRFDPQIRKDKTQWWNFNEPTIAQLGLVEFLNELKEVCNKELFLGLNDCEGHYAVYDVGAFYKRHLDRFQNDNKRILSVVYFLNDEWAEKDGGELCLYLRNEESGASEIEKKIRPNGNRLVVFLSDEIPHEVLETRRKRYSFAGWFRSR